MPGTQGKQAGTYFTGGETEATETRKCPLAPLPSLGLPQGNQHVRGLHTHATHPLRLLRRGAVHPGDSPSTRITLESCSTDFPQAACTVTRVSPGSANRVVTEFSRVSRGCRAQTGLRAMGGGGAGEQPALRPAAPCSHGLRGRSSAGVGPARRHGPQAGTAATPPAPLLCGDAGDPTSRQGWLQLCTPFGPPELTLSSGAVYELGHLPPGPGSAPTLWDGVHLSGLAGTQMGRQAPAHRAWLEMGELRFEPGARALSLTWPVPGKHDPKRTASPSWVPMSGPPAAVWGLCLGCRAAVC